MKKWSLHHPTTIFFILFVVALLLSAKIKCVLDDLHIWMYVHKTELLICPTMCFQFSQAGFPHKWITEWFIIYLLLLVFHGGSLKSASLHPMLTGIVVQVTSVTSDHTQCINLQDSAAVCIEMFVCMWVATHKYWEPSEHIFYIMQKTSRSGSGLPLWMRWRGFISQLLIEGTHDTGWMDATGLDAPFFLLTVSSFKNNLFPIPSFKSALTLQTLEQPADINQMWSPSR